jgi:HK97 gp10 family phage protein
MKLKPFHGMMGIWRWYALPYKSYINKAKNALSKSKKEICNEIGTFITAEAQLRATVDTGNMKRSTAFDVHDDNNGVDIGVTKDAEYAPFVEKGTSKQQAQPFLEPAAMDNLGKLEEIAGQKLSINMSGE